jgi:hypothetical protein
MTMGRACWFGWLVSYTLDNSMTRPIGGVLAHLGNPHRMDAFTELFVVKKTSLTKRQSFSNLALVLKEWLMQRMCWSKRLKLLLRI